MAFSDETSYTGQQNISTFNGNILIDSARGEIAIRETGSPIKRTILDKDGTHIQDSLGRNMTRLDTLGLTTIEPATGRQRNRVGIASSDGRTGNWTTAPGVDLRDEGI